MAITTTESLLKLLQKSNLLSDDQLSQSQQAAGKAADAAELAGSLVHRKLLTRWQAGQLLAGRASFFLGRYKLIDLLGQGGMGKVFYGEDPMMARPVALKIISKQLGRDPASLERFLSEARAVAALNHPNIVHAYTVDREGDRYFLVMEFVEGRDLERTVRADGPLDVARAVDYVRQAAEGLAHAHGRNMVHCDVKPANLFVNRQGVVKILDLGMARLLARDQAQSNAEDQQVMGTVDYMAPEQAVASPDLDHRVDVYSLGCTFYFLLTGHPPFPEGTLAERIVKHQTQAPTPLRDERPGVSGQLAAICEKMMAKQPEARFQSVAEVGRLLAQWKPSEEKQRSSQSTTSTSTDAAARAPQNVFPEKPDADSKPALKRALRIADAVGTDIPSAKATPAGPREEDMGPFGIKIDTQGTLVHARRGATARKVQDEKASPACSADGPLRRFLADRRKVIAAASIGAIAVIGLAAAGLVLSSGDSPPSHVDAATATAGKPAADAHNRTASDEEGTDQGGKGNAPDDGSRDEGFPELTIVEGGLPANQGGLSGAKKPAAAPDKNKPDRSSPKTPPTGAPSEEPSKKPEKPAAEKPKPPAEKPKSAAKPQTPSPPSPPPPSDPLQDLQTLVALPELRDNDPPGEKSKAPISFGEIHAASDVTWGLLLLGGEDALKGDRKFVLGPDKTGQAGASWLVQLDAAAGKERVRSPVARLSRDGNSLHFRWADGAQASSANYLRNCVVQVRIQGKTKYVLLREPVAVDPLVIDLTRGQANQAAAMKWIPADEKLRIQVTQVEGRKEFALQPAEPVPPKTPVMLSFARTDRHGNTRDGVGLRFFLTVKRSSVALELRLLTPPAADFRPFEAFGYSSQQWRVKSDLLANERGKLERQAANAKGAERTKLSQQIDLIGRQIWYLDFYVDVHKRAKVHYRIFLDAGGQEVVLATSESDQPAEE